ncbi:DUF1428 domain-containing protein [Pseudomarimonas salicorniae]|uniref:DUF1428 domain-containing protein n=1 Tax=Pseudomarimonas salicorniae TaxID=2933270 RepID=A0ABT0GLU3_9GAMM|nr:DUF1428 domain-containing protein [Lysobacter sp. CAU 1642]MCK7595486.1 DUF1428 domain-containing protein [Lysobacter sp. CAU 1642]
MYVQGFLVPVPEGNEEKYREVAEKFWRIARDYGALSQFECWEDDIKDGVQTDFRRAVNLQAGEKVVFAWMTWPDKETADASHERMMSDERMKTDFGAPDGSDMPFDGKRMVYGGFRPIVQNVA